MAFPIYFSLLPSLLPFTLTVLYDEYHIPYFHNLPLFCTALMSQFRTVSIIGIGYTHEYKFVPQYRHKPAISIFPWKKHPNPIRLRCFHPSFCYSIVIPYPCECIASFLDKRYKQYWFMLIPSRLDCSESWRCRLLGIRNLNCPE